jgi:hypothetical protein
MGSTSPPVDAGTVLVTGASAGVGDRALPDQADWPRTRRLPHTNVPAVEDGPGHLPRIAGVPAGLVPATLIPAIAAAGYAPHRHGR